MHDDSTPQHHGGSVLDLRIALVSRQGRAPMNDAYEPIKLLPKFIFINAYRCCDTPFFKQANIPGIRRKGFTYAQQKIFQ
jgi:hypothetical protein